MLAGSMMMLGFCPIANAAAQGWSPTKNLTPLDTTKRRDARDPMISVDSEGMLHVVYREKEIYYLRSEDKGRTWSQPVKASGERLVNGAPTVLKDRDGIHIVWPSLTIEPTHTHYQLYYVRSEDQGATWTAPVQLTSLESHSSEPRLFSTRTGIALLWYELDERDLPRKDQVDPAMLLNSMDNPIDALIPREYHRVLRNTVLTMTSTSGGRSWGRPAMIREILRPLDYFMPYPIGDNSFGFYWSENLKISNLVTRDGGVTWNQTWDLDQYLDTFFYNQPVYTPEGTLLIGIPRQPFKSQRIREYDVSTRQEKLITQPTFFRSIPRAAYGAGETHLVWSISDDMNTWVAYQRSDRIPPKTVIVSPEDPKITTETFRIAWEGRDDISDNLTYSRLTKYGGTQWTLFEPGQFVEVKTPPDGKYTFKIRAKDEAGNIEPDPAMIEFDTYGVPPNTLLETQPPGEVLSRSVQIAWSGTDNTLTDPSDLEYSYRIDDGAWSDWGKFRSQTFRGLREGPHEVQVRSRDNHPENVDPTPAVAKFDVVLGIEVTFKTQPSKTLNRPQIQFSWTGSDRTQDNMPLFFSYRIDGGPASEWSIIDTASFDGLTEGAHNFEVRARDEIGNESKIPLVHEFFVDMTPPETSAKLAQIIKENGYTPIVSLGGMDNLTAQDDLRFEYRVGNEDWQSLGEENSIVLPSGLSPWSQGYRVEVRAIDGVQNRDTTPSVIDLTFPGRYLRYGMTDLGVPIVYPILFALLLILILAALLAIVILIYRRFRAPKKSLLPDEEVPMPKEEEKTGSGMFDDDDDLFGTSSSGKDKDKDESKEKSPFDDGDDLFG